jgi:two-component system sensor histidine kinase DesK
MLGFLAYPATDVLARRLTVTGFVIVFAAMAVFAALWLRTMWLALGTITPFAGIAPWLTAATLVGCGLAFWLGSVQATGMFIYLSIACAVSLPLRWTLPGIIASTLAALLLLLVRVPAPITGDLVFGQLSYVFWLGAMMLFYRRTILLIGELRQARGELARLAVTEERLRFARDLHDLLGHSLSVISLKSQLVERLLDRDPAAAAGEVADIAAVAGSALVEVREAVTGYRRRDLAAELRMADGAITDAGMHAVVEGPGTALPPAVDDILAWVVREGTTNVVRHSGARTCRIAVCAAGDTASVEIVDDGVGPTSTTAGNGLTGLGERLAAAGGTLEWGAATGGGYRLGARLPIAAHNSDALPSSTRPVPAGTP